jgi:anaerobic magnesium-protoporphyrin IX monomethyl ester cyclase
MRIVLVNPCPEVELQRHRFGIGHLGLAYVAACLRRAGHEIRVVDAKAENLNRADTIQRILDLSPRLVGLTAMTVEIHYVASICAAIKQALPDCVTMVGGAHPSALPEQTVSEFPAIDIAIRGEGEQTAVEIAEAGTPRSAPRVGAHSGHRLSRRERGRPQSRSPLRRRPGHDPLPGLGPLSSEQRRLADLRRARLPVPLRLLPASARQPHPTAQRGQHHGRDRRPGGATGQKSSWFQDETFGVNRAWTHELLDRLIERNRRRGYVWYWKANSRANLADEALYRKMKKAGCKMLDFGVESGNPEILKRIHKNITLRQAQEAIRAAQAAGLRTNAFSSSGIPARPGARPCRRCVSPPNSAPTPSPSA